MSTWQIYSDSGNNFRWEISPSTKLPPSHHNHLPSSSLSPPHLPSFHDVLIQGCSILLYDNCESNNLISKKRNLDEDVPMFRTGLGKSVVLSKSSIAKAASVLGDDFRDNFDTGQPRLKGDDLNSPNSMFSTGLGKLGGHGFSSPSSMFQTGSGKTVNISSSGLLRAKALLGAIDNNEDCTLEPAKKRICGNASNFEKLPNLSKAQMVINSGGTENGTRITKAPFHLNNDLLKDEIVNEDIGRLMQPEMCSSSAKSSAIKFNTAGGRSISVSSDALQRARSLLGDPEIDSFLDEENPGASIFSFSKQGNTEGSFFNKDSTISSSLSHLQFERRDQNPKIFVSPMKQSSQVNQLEIKSETLVSGTNLISKFNAEDSICRSSSKLSCPNEPLHENPLVCHPPVQQVMVNGVASGPCSVVRPSRGPLVDITNIIASDSTSKKGTVTEPRRAGRRNSVTPFKMPRSSKFVTSLNSNARAVSNGVSSRLPEASYTRRKVSSRYPSHSRTNIKNFLKGPPYSQNLELISEQVRHINSESSEKYTFSVGADTVGVEAFVHMLVQSGASAQHMTKGWVANHYRWIVWKLASYERFYSATLMKEFLTVSNVLEELKYRYEREVNHGHRSAIKRILEGDASPSSMLVLCVAAICSDHENTSSTNLTGERTVARIELTDGWYSIHAQLDLLLSKHLASGKLFVGQKLQICGAGLNAWEGPVSPLEASSSVSLLLHINGTYRANWDARLGFCKGACPPLAFRCIKGNGGPVPRTLVGVTRIYPVLYRERLKSGGFIARSEKMEAAIAQLFDQRRANIIEAITVDFQRASSCSSVMNDNDNEGAKILKKLENAAEPELMMAGMSSEQLALFSKYRAKVEDSRQSDLQRLIEKAIEEAGLSAREVSPFMRVRVVGLKCKGQVETKDQKIGLITIWNPTERQKLELVEGHAYAISGLMPSHSDAHTVYLQARGPSSRWQLLTTLEKESFMPFFDHRKPIILAKMGEVALSSEFDTAMLVLHVGAEYVAGQQKKQWMFVTDGSSESKTAQSTVSLLAISFCSPCTDDDSGPPINSNLVGSILCFCNLVKRAKDHMNHMWVAEATENSTYYLSYDHRYCSHLKDAFGSVKNWQQSASTTIEKLRERIWYIVGGPKV